MESPHCCHGATSATICGVPARGVDRTRRIVTSRHSPPITDSILDKCGELTGRSGLNTDILHFIPVIVNGEEVKNMYAEKLQLGQGLIGTWKMERL